MRVVYGRRAQTDISDIFDHISQADPVTALAVENAIRKACDGLGHFPYANVATDLAHVYRMPIPSRGFTVFYRVRAIPSVIEIVRVVRSSRIKNLGRVPRG
jgi:plasmid stabilization system protein ParE